MRKRLALARNGEKCADGCYLTSRTEYEAAGAGIGAAWKETLGRNFPPSTLLYIDGLVDARAKVEIEVTAFIAKVA
jgi:enamine deaminase RidA (YjgF/YER057c/UK114 family)